MLYGVVVLGEAGVVIEDGLAGGLAQVLGEVIGSVRGVPNDAGVHDVGGLGDLKPEAAEKMVGKVLALAKQMQVRMPLVPFVDVRDFDDSEAVLDVSTPEATLPELTEGASQKVELVLERSRSVFESESYELVAVV